ncbi:histidine triad nucleotide-binding protein [Nitratiruptor sp. YY09-18]|uniref:histidine triad nucleotide-binding protein n=1 Tax=Nitratiruptor sp. YY09-18 TaxID=2724901 RepID=UPI0019158271|nr:histidine triad nucleotide-binding protein [Nitratiruptor sp. YY09-18]BCD68349.1 histidine triad family protein [Nitratiruptor sp. YY09-18]
MCIFCKIVAGEIPSNKVHENDEFLAFHDINPKAPIHILIIPKQHIENFQSCPGEVMANMTPFIQEVAKKLDLDKTGYRLITNNGEDGGQEVMHLHFHMLGGAKLSWPYQAIEKVAKKYM